MTATPMTAHDLTSAPSFKDRPAPPP
ncbi:MAG: hypothetical protein RI988_1501, partial [Pseudomonadota bacterium]